MPKKIPAGRARVGDVLAESVIHGAGQMLLVEGTVLDQDQIDMLQQRGVLLVTLVDGVDDGAETDTGPPAPPDPEEMKRIVVEEARWFGESRKDPVMAEVFRFAVKRRSGGAVDA